MRKGIYLAWCSVNTGKLCCLFSSSVVIMQLPPGDALRMPERRGLLSSSSTVLALAAVREYHGLHGLSNESLFLTILEARSKRSRCQHAGLSVKAVFWVYRLLAIVSLHAVVREGRREAGRGGAPVFLLMRVLIPS